MFIHSRKQQEEKEGRKKKSLMAQKNMKKAIKMSIEWKQEEKQQIFHLYLCACENIKFYTCVNVLVRLQLQTQYWEFFFENKEEKFKDKNNFFTRKSKNKKDRKWQDLGHSS